MCQHFYLLFDAEQIHDNFKKSVYWNFAWTVLCNCWNLFSVACITRHEREFIHPANNHTLQGWIAMSLRASPARNVFQLQATLNGKKISFQKSDSDQTWTDITCDDCTRGRIGSVMLQPKAVQQSHESSLMRKSDKQPAGLWRSWLCEWFTRLGGNSAVLVRRQQLENSKILFQMTSSSMFSHHSRKITRLSPLHSEMVLIIIRCPNTYILVQTQWQFIQTSYLETAKLFFLHIFQLLTVFL